MGDKKRFTESVRDFFLHLEFSTKYNNSGLILGWLLRVQVRGGEYATFNVKGREFPSSIVNQVIKNGWYLCECDKGYFGPAESFEDDSDKVLAFINARRDGYTGRPVNRTEYEGWISQSAA